MSATDPSTTVDLRLMQQQSGAQGYGFVPQRLSPPGWPNPGGEAGRRVAQAESRAPRGAVRHEMLVPTGRAGRIIGPGGAIYREMVGMTGSAIVLCDYEQPPPGYWSHDQKLVVLVGREEQVVRARDLINEKVHGAAPGGGGGAGAVFSHGETASPEVRAQEVQGIEARAARVLQMRPGSTREDVSIEEARLAAIIGKGGMEYKRLVATSGCEIIIDSKGWLPSTPVGRRVIVMIGLPEQLDLAKRAISSLVEAAARLSAHEQTRGVGGGASRFGPGEGNWECPKCLNDNWPLRQFCNRCKAPRPQGEAQAGGQGGASGLHPPQEYSGCGGPQYGGASHAAAEAPPGTNIAAMVAAMAPQAVGAAGGCYSCGGGGGGGGCYGGGYGLSGVGGVGVGVGGYGGGLSGERLSRDHGYRRVGDVSAPCDVETVNQLLADRQAAKLSRDFNAADQLREQLRGLGINVHDKERTWSVGGSFMVGDWSRYSAVSKAGGSVDGSSPRPSGGTSAIAASGPLPPGWTSHDDPSGRAYYHNAATGESTYSHPGEAAAAPRAPAPAAPAAPLAGFDIVAAARAAKERLAQRAAEAAAASASPAAAAAPAAQATLKRARDEQ